MMKRLLILMLLCSTVARAQQPLCIGQTHTLRSQVLSEDRVLNVYLPEHYRADDTARFPVIYLLDGSANEDFLHMAGLVQYLAMIGKIKESIVVGIANTNRRHDFTFPSKDTGDQKLVPEAGGAAAFLQFLAKELQPYIETGYRCNGRRTLVGQSLGGLMAAQVLLRQPQLFNRYLIVSPSLWWDKESLLADPDTFALQTAPATRVYIATGKEGRQMETDARKMADLLKAHNPRLNVRYTFFPAEDHLTILHNCAYKGLAALCAD